MVSSPGLKAVLFDAAGTLIDSRFDLPQFALDIALDSGLELRPEAAQTLAEMYRERRPEHERVEATRDEAAVEAFWLRLTEDWLVLEGADRERGKALRRAARRRMFGGDGTFAPFPDAVLCLQTLRDAGLRLAVVSNWDRTLHDALRYTGLDGYFEFALASLEEGVEKPDPRLFQIALDRLGIGPDETVHVGDNPVDDIEGATAAGIRAVHLDREGVAEGSIRTLAELPARLGLA